MKSKYVILTAALMLSASTFAQKDQLKAAEKALKNDNAAESKTILQGIETLIATATEAEKAQYYFVKGNTLVNLANKNVEATANQIEAGKAFAAVLTTEKAAGKNKYSDDAKIALATAKDKLVNIAVAEGQKDNYAGGAIALKAVYDLDTTDLEKLYYAAGYAINAKDYDMALKFYQELKDKNYTGEATGYYAKSLVSDKEDYFGVNEAAKKDRDEKVKMKLYIEPRDEKVPSKKGEIYKNIVLILVSKNKNEEAKAAFADAKANNPDDTSLLDQEAELYYKLGDLVTYKKLVTEAIAKNPTNAILIYNMGVVSRKTNQNVDAENYFKRAIEIDPTYADAYLNLAEVKLSYDEKFINEMNKLGNNEKDNKRYIVIKAEREKMFKDTLPFLEKANELIPTNEPLAKTLLGVYKALEMTDKIKALKAKMPAPAGK